MIRFVISTTRGEEIMERRREGKREQYHGILLCKSTRQERRRTRDCSELHWLRRRLQRKEKTQKKRGRDDEQEEKEVEINIQREIGIQQNRMNEKQDDENECLRYYRAITKY